MFSAHHHLLSGSVRRGARSVRRDSGRNPLRAFTILELLVVIATISLLVGILLPAIGRARDNALLTKSQSNLKQIGSACNAYAIDHNDRQVTWINDYFSRYANGATTNISLYEVFGNFAEAIYGPGGYGGSPGSKVHPWLIMGDSEYTILATLGQAEDHGIAYIPFDWARKFGSFRIPNARSMSNYLNGRFYDPVFYAPKDTQVLASVEPYFENANDYVFTQTPFQSVKWSSYCFSPAAMFSPDVFSFNKSTGKYYTNEWTLQAGFRSPTMSQATYSDLKTHMIEHHWLQNRKKNCIVEITGSPYDGCQPYFFNGSVESAPVTLFYDGHIGSVGQRDAIESCFRLVQQTGQSNGGTWSKDTPLGGCYEDWPACSGSGGGYFMDYALDWTNTSYHILTSNGIRGRDVIAH